MINIEKVLIGWLNSVKVSGLTAYADIPPKRPARFITVERVGGPTGLVVDRPLVSVQVWDASRTEASDAAVAVRDALLQFVADSRDVGGLDVQSLINNPDPDSGQARYQITVAFVTK